MLNSKLDFVTIGNNFENLIEQKYKIEKQNRKELSRERTNLWNCKVEQEKYYENQLKNIEEERANKLENLTKEYENNKKKLALTSLDKIKDLNHKKDNLIHKFNKDVIELKRKFELLLKQKNGELFESSHLHVIGYPKNTTVEDFIKL
jgi:hypothetical protein